MQVDAEIGYGQFVIPSRAKDGLTVGFQRVPDAKSGNNVSLVFSDLTVQTVQPGYAPFIAPGSGPDFKFPLL